LEHLKLSEEFVKAIAGQESNHASLKESSKGQQTWRQMVYFDEEGHMFVTND
jgi:hypothetical protein